MLKAKNGATRAMPVFHVQPMYGYCLGSNAYPASIPATPFGSGRDIGESFYGMGRMITTTS